MQNHPECVLCGANVQFMHTGDQGTVLSENRTNMKEMITWISYTSAKPYSHWIMNHPTFCFRRSAVLSVGNYNVTSTKSIGEDLELELKLLKQYGVLYNIPDVLLHYRIHPDQVTFTGKPAVVEGGAWRNKMIEAIVNEDN